LWEDKVFSVHRSKTPLITPESGSNYTDRTCLGSLLKILSFTEQKKWSLRSNFFHRC
jgi:hypothetical protein